MAYEHYPQDLPGFPFALTREKKDAWLTQEMLRLTLYHREHCEAYRKITDADGFDARKIRHYRELPFLPVTLFKELRLSSLENEDTSFKLVNSSGTSGQKRSQIILDADTRTRQQLALTRIGSSFLGPKRMPYLVIDCPAVIHDPAHFTARASGIVGFSIFGAHRTFALRDDMSLDLEAVRAFLERYGNGRFLIFGFTFMIWEYFCRALEREGLTLDCSNAVLLHGGGWKKMQSQAVSKEEYRQRLEAVCGVKHVLEYYGMAEQTGSIFFECECGHLHCSDYSGILMRRPEDFQLCEPGQEGLIEVLSVLPGSYPGHILLTEDKGRLLGVDDCPCGRAGEYFEVHGRVEHAELRGCSDTYEAPGSGKTL